MNNCLPPPHLRDEVDEKSQDDILITHQTLPSKHHHHFTSLGTDHSFLGSINPTSPSLSANDPQYDLSACRSITVSGNVFNDNMLLASDIDTDNDTNLKMHHSAEVCSHESSFQSNLDGSDNIVIQDTKMKELRHKSIPCQKLDAKMPFDQNFFIPERSTSTTENNDKSTSLRPISCQSSLSTSTW